MAPPATAYRPISEDFTRSVLSGVEGTGGPLGMIGGTIRTPASSTTTKPISEYILPTGDVQKSPQEKERINRDFRDVMRNAEAYGRRIVGLPTEMLTAIARTPVRSDLNRVAEGELNTVPAVAQFARIDQQQKQRTATRDSLLSRQSDISTEVPLDIDPVGGGLSPAMLERLYAELRPMVTAALPFGLGEVANRVLPVTPSVALREQGMEEPNKGRDLVRAIMEGGASILPYMLTKTPAQFAGVSAGTTLGEGLAKEEYGERQDAGALALKTLLSGATGYGIGKAGEVFTVPGVKTIPASVVEAAAKAGSQGSIAYANQVLQTAVDIADKEQIPYDEALAKAQQQIDADPSSFWKTVGEFGLFNLPGLARNVRNRMLTKPEYETAFEEARRRYAQKGPAAAANDAQLKQPEKTPPGLLQNPSLPSSRVQVSPTPPPGESRLLVSQSGLEKPASIVAGQEVNAAPSEAQKEAGNYKKGHTELQGLDLSIENPTGTTRSGVDPSGKNWETTMTADYGYIRGTQGKDKDHIDVFVGPQHGSEFVYVVNQRKANSDDLDEHKVILGTAGEQEAKQLYLSNYSAEFANTQRGGVQGVPMNMEQFKSWLETGDHKKPAAGVTTSLLFDEQGRQAGDASFGRSTEPQGPVVPVSALKTREERIAARAEAEQNSGDKTQTVVPPVEPQPELKVSDLKTGDIIRFVQDYDYAKAGQTYKIEEVGKGRRSSTVNLINTKTGGRIQTNERVLSSLQSQRKVFERAPITEKLEASGPVVAGIQPASVDQSIVEDPLHLQPVPIAEAIQQKAAELRHEALGWEVIKAGGRATHENVGEGYEFTKRLAGGGISTFPEWFNELGVSKTRVIDALDKIIRDKGADKGKLVEGLKSVLLKEGTEGAHRVEGYIPPDEHFAGLIKAHREGKLDEYLKTPLWVPPKGGSVVQDAGDAVKYDKTKAGLQGNMFDIQAQASKKAITSDIPLAKQVEGTMFAPQKPEEKTGDLFKVAESGGPEQLRNMTFDTPDGGSSITPKRAFDFREAKTKDPMEEWESLADLAAQPDSFRFHEVLGKGWTDWPTSLHLADQIKKGEPITVYRSSDVGGILPGSYVTELKQYAQEHGETGIPGGKFKMYEEQVYPDELLSYGDPHEFLYIPRDVETAHQRLQPKARTAPTTGVEESTLDTEQPIEYTSPEIREHTKVAFTGGYRAARRAINDVAGQLDLFAEDVSRPGRGLPGSAFGSEGRRPKKAGTGVPTALRTIPAGIQRIGRIDYHDVTLSDTPSTRAGQLAQMGQVIHHPKIEHMVVVFVKHGKPIAAHAYTSGVINTVMLGNSFGYKVRRHAYRLGADEVAIIHNHPSGDPTPSPGDHIFTRQLGDALESPSMSKAVGIAEGVDTGTPPVKLRTHVVIDHGEYTHILRTREGDVVAITGGETKRRADATWPKSVADMTGTESIAAFGKMILQDPSKVGIVYANQKLGVVGYELRPREFLDKGTAKEVMQDGARSHGANAVFVVGNFGREGLLNPPESLRESPTKLWVQDVVDQQLGLSTTLDAPQRLVTLVDTPRANQVYEGEVPFQKTIEPPGKEGEGENDYTNAAAVMNRGGTGSPGEFFQYIAPRRVQYGREAFRLDQKMDRDMAKANAAAVQEVAEQFTDRTMRKRLEKVLGERGAVSVARTLRELPFSNELFGIRKNRRQLLSLVLESVKEKTSDGTLVFGAQEKISEAELGRLLMEAKRKTQRLDQIGGKVKAGDVAGEKTRKAMRGEMAILYAELEDINTKIDALRESTDVVDREIPMATLPKKLQKMFPGQESINLTQDGESLYSQLTPRERTVVNWFSGWRDEMKEQYHIPGKVEGYVRRFMLDPRHPFLQSILNYKNNKFFNKIAGSRYFRTGGNYDYMRDMEQVAYKMRSELEAERIHNTYTPLILQSMIEPVSLSPIEAKLYEMEVQGKLKKEDVQVRRKELWNDAKLKKAEQEWREAGAGMKKSYVPVDKSMMFGDTAYQFKGQLPKALYNEFLKIVEEPQANDSEVFKATQNMLKSGANFWTANQLVAAQSIANQAVSDAMFVSAKLIHDIPNPRQIVYDIRALGDALRPSMLKVYTPEEFGSHATFTSQIPLNEKYHNPLDLLRPIFNVYFKAFGAFDLYAKRAIFIGQAREVMHRKLADLVARGKSRDEAKELLKGFLTDPELVRQTSEAQGHAEAVKYDNPELNRDIDEILDAYMPNYGNIPAIAERYADNPLGKVLTPFIRYKYEELRITGAILRRGLQATNLKTKMPVDQRMGDLLLASVLFGGAFLLAQRYKSKLLDEDEDQAKDIAAGRYALPRGSIEDHALRAGLTDLGVTLDDGNTLMLRTSKYPFLKYGMLLRSGPDRDKIIQSEFLSEGIALRLIMMNAGWHDEFNKYTTQGPGWGNELRSLVPFHRVVEDINKIHDPRVLVPETFGDAVLRAIPGAQQGGKEATSKQTGRPLTINKGLSTILATTGVNIADLPEEEIAIAAEQGRVHKAQREKREKLIQRYSRSTSMEDRAAIRSEARRAGIKNLREASRQEVKEEEVGKNESAVLRELIRAKKEGDGAAWDVANEKARKLGMSRMAKKKALEELGMKYARP